MQRQDDDNPRPPLLDLLIIVTLVTIVVALGYLLHHTLGDGEKTVGQAPASLFQSHQATASCTEPGPAPNVTPPAGSASLDVAAHAAERT